MTIGQFGYVLCFVRLANIDRSRLKGELNRIIGFRLPFRRDLVELGLAFDLLASVVERR